MVIEPFPADFQTGSSAFVFDNISSVFDINSVHCGNENSGTVYVYTLESIVSGTETDLRRILRSYVSSFRLGEKKRDLLLGYVRNSDYPELLNYFNHKNLVMGNMKVSKGHLIKLLEFCNFFRNLGGFVVDEKDGQKTDEEGSEDPIANQMLAYNKSIEMYRPLVPKVFFLDRLGSPATLRLEIEARYVKDYKEKLRNAGLPLDARGVDYLTSSIQTLKSMRMDNRISNPHLQQDMMVVALAYAVPETHVTIFTCDNDVKALNILAEHLVPDKTVKTEMLRRSH